MVRRGEIWWAELPEPAGSEPGYRWPVLIVQADSFNRSAIRTVVCAVITSNLRLADAPGNVRLSPHDSGLPKPSVVNVSQIAAVDKAFLTEQVGTLASQVMKRVDEGLRLVMSL